MSRCQRVKHSSYFKRAKTRQCRPTGYGDEGRAGRPMYFGVRPISGPQIKNFT